MYFGLKGDLDVGMETTAQRARRITWNSSRQSFLTAALLADPDLADHCLRAYAYFRWVDDCVDLALPTKAERLAFIQRQQQIMKRLYAGEPPADLSPEEAMLADLVANPHGLQPGLRSFLDNFLFVVAFDAERRGSWVTQKQLEGYTRALALAVMDGLQYFIGNGYAYPQSLNREVAVVGAHITHMLRDMREDTSVGMLNAPQEMLLEDGQLNFESAKFRQWVKGQVELARSHFHEGKEYIQSLNVLRCQLAGVLYCARFESLLDVIERDGYLLRWDYSHTRSRWTSIRCIFLGLQTTGGFYLRQIKRLAERAESFFGNAGEKKTGMNRPPSARPV
jgi:phytoene/squalene synthetase